MDVRVLPPNSPPKDERSTPSRCMGLLAGPDVPCAASTADSEFMVRFVGFGCRCMTAVRASRGSGHGWPSLEAGTLVAHAISGTEASRKLLVHRVARWECSHIEADTCVPLMLLRCRWTQTSYRRWEGSGAVLQCQARVPGGRLRGGGQQCGERRRTKKAYLGYRLFAASATTALCGDVCATART